MTGAPLFTNAWLVHIAAVGAVATAATAADPQAIQDLFGYTDRLLFAGLGVLSGTVARAVTWFDEEDGFQWRAFLGDAGGVLFLTLIAAGLSDWMTFTAGPTAAMGGALGIAGIDFATRLIKTTFSGLVKSYLKQGGQP